MIVSTLFFLWKARVIHQAAKLLIFPGFLGSRVAYQLLSKLSISGMF